MNAVVLSSLAANLFQEGPGPPSNGQVCTTKLPPSDEAGLDMEKITLLRVIPTMTFIHFLTGKSSGILSDISSDILFGILSGISSGI